MILVIQHKVRDFDAWKPVFDEQEPVRQTYGCTGHFVFRDSAPAYRPHGAAAVSLAPGGGGVSSRAVDGAGHAAWRCRERAAPHVVKETEAVDRRLCEAA